jgi:hypothetical protein
MTWGSVGVDRRQHGAACLVDSTPDTCYNGSNTGGNAMIRHVKDFFVSGFLDSALHDLFDWLFRTVGPCSIE